MRHALDALAEQAEYIWFTRELDAQESEGAPRAPRGSASPKPKAKPPTAAGNSGGLESRYSKQNGLLALNLLIFEVLHYAPRESGDATAEHASLAYVVRKGGGPAALFTLCVLYKAVARRIGVDVQLVRLALPTGLRGRGPSYLLRLPAEGEAMPELYVDVLAEGRLRSAHDLKAFADSALGLLPDTVLAGLAVELSAEEGCEQLLAELEAACRGADNLAEAAFWKLQLEVLQGQIALARQEREGRPEGAGGDA